MVCELYLNKAVTYIHTYIHIVGAGDEAQRGRDVLLEKVVREHLKQMTSEQKLPCVEQQRHPVVAPG